jgi:hypothetical protein
MRTLDEIRRELDAAIERRAELWESLAEGPDQAKSDEAAELSDLIDRLWAEQRLARARARFGDPSLIIARARAEDRLEREARRLRRAA